MTIPFPEHWKTKKWDCDNAPSPEESEIRHPIDSDECVKSNNTFSVVGSFAH